MKKLVVTAAAIAAFLASNVAGAREIYTTVVDSDGVQRVDILGGSYFFKPDYIIVKVNVPVELKVKKEPGFAPHDIIIDAPEAGISVNESLKEEPKVVRFTPIKAGKYPFYCGKKLLLWHKHRDKGMEGTLEVTE